MDISAAPPLPASEVSAPPQCAICRHNPSLYTCPRCSTKTCSLSCSKSHKMAVSCSGVRDKAKYVPMNQYTWGTLMDDYSYLENVGRKVEEWGTEISRGGYGSGSAGNSTSTPRGGGGGGRGRGRGRGGRAGPSGSQSKKDLLKMHLETKDISIEFLPEGMRKRKLNQSNWNVKEKVALLTVEYLLYPPRRTSSDTPPSDPLSLLVHRNSLSTPLGSLIHDCLAEKSQKDALPTWTAEFVSRSARVDSGLCFYILEYPPESFSRAYFALDPRLPLGTLLAGKSFVEWPTVEVYGAEGEFGGRVVGEETDRVPVAKRQKVSDFDGEQSKKKELERLGGYASDSGSEEGAAVALNMLEDYGSDEALEDNEEPDIRDRSRESDAEVDQEPGGDKDL